MKLCRYNDNRLGVVESDLVHDVTEALDCLAQARYPFPPCDSFIANLGRIRERISSMVPAGAHRLQDVTLLSPVANPGKLVAAPVNYKAHLEEAVADEATFSRAHVRQIHETGLFLKATSSLVGCGSAIELVHLDRRTDHEVELAVVIGRICRNVDLSAALSCVAGYAIGLDITMRGPEERSLRKSLDTYSVLGPWLVTADEFGDPTGRQLSLSVDGQPRQRANTRDLIMSVPALIAFASSYYTLQPGDVIYSGTPEGVGPILPGNVIDASIEGIGDLTMRVQAGKRDGTC